MSGAMRPLDAKFKSCSRSVAFTAPQINRRASHQRCRAEPLPSDVTVQKASSDDIMARLAKARGYKAKAQDPPTPSVAPSAASPTVPEVTVAPSPESDATLISRMGDYAAQQAAGEEERFLAAQKELPPSLPPSASEVDRSFRGGAGDASQAANWLRVVPSSSPGIDKNLRAEEFTLKKEEIQRQQGATIERAKGIVQGTRRRTYTDDGYGLAQQQDEAEASMAAERVDAAAAAAAEAAAKAADATDALGRPIGGSAGGPEVQQAPGETEEEGVDFHKPKVATWGVFPRPRNISEAYGGGRNLRPGQDLETAEQAAQRKQRVSEALASYRKQMGLEIDPEIEAQAQKLFEDGEALFKAGRISAALDKFSTAADLVPLRSRIGGQVNLQKAICLDSLGRNDDAYAIYTKLEGHNAPGVAKATKRMLFGFKAAKNLKVETMSYSGGGTQAWKQYFDRIGAGTWAAYKASGEESEEDAAAARQAGLVAAAVVLLPFAFVGILIAK